MRSEDDEEDVGSVCHIEGQGPYQASCAIRQLAARKEGRYRRSYVRICTLNEKRHLANRVLT